MATAWAPTPDSSSGGGDSSCSSDGSLSEAESSLVSERVARKQEKKARKKEKKARKREKKARKKEKKARKRDRKAQKHAKKREHSVGMEDASPGMQQEGLMRKKARAEMGGDASSSSTSGGALSFFAQLHREEAQKPALGTIHAAGRTVSEARAKASTDWECQKCGESNFSNSADCRKCHALKRLTTYR